MGGTAFFSVLGQLAEADPGRPALTCGEVTLTRAEFAERVERLAALFADFLGLGWQMAQVMALGAVGSFAISSAMILHAFRKGRISSK